MTKKRFISFVKKYILPTHLMARFVLIILIPMVVMQALVGLFFYNRHWDTLSRQLAVTVTGEIRSVAEWIEAEPNNVNEKLSHLGDILRLKFEWHPNEVLTEQDKLRKTPASSDLRHELKTLPFPLKTWSESEGNQIILIQLSKGVFQVSVPRKRFFSSTVPVFLIWMIGSSFLLFGIAFLFMKNQVRAMVRLARAAELFGMGQPLVRFKP